MAPDATSITRATTNLISTTRRTWLTLTANRRADPGHAVDVMLAVLSPLWPFTPPESARDALCIAARNAVNAGVTTVPDSIADATATFLLDMTAEWLAANPGDEVIGAPIGPPGNPPLTFASSCAFDRDEDAETLGSLAVLCVLAETGARP